MLDTEDNRQVTTLWQPKELLNSIVARWLQVASEMADSSCKLSHRSLHGLCQDDMLYKTRARARVCACVRACVCVWNYHHSQYLPQFSRLQTHLFDCNTITALNASCHMTSLFLKPKMFYNNKLWYSATKNIEWNEYCTAIIHINVSTGHIKHLTTEPRSSMTDARVVVL